MKAYLLTLLFSVFSFCAYAQKETLIIKVISHPKKEIKYGLIGIDGKEAIPIKFEFIEEKGGKIIDVLTKKEFNVVALMHTHPNGSGPSGSGGDGAFMAAHFPFKPMYVLMIKKEDISRSSISFIVGSENPYNNTNGYSGYAIYDLDKNLTIANLIKTPKGYPLRELTLQNKANFKLTIPKFSKK